MTWTRVYPEELRVADAVRFDVWYTRRDADGKELTKPREPGKPLEPIKTSVTVVGRIIYVGSDLPSLRPGFLFERTNIGPFPEGTHVTEPMFVVSSRDMRKLSRLDDQPRHVCNVAGGSYMKSLLHAAAGGDHTNPEAVARVAACVQANELWRAKAEGRKPRRMGEERAIWSLSSASNAASETVIRQLDGRIPIPETDEPELTNR